MSLKSPPHQSSLLLSFWKNRDMEISASSFQVCSDTEHSTMAKSIKLRKLLEKSCDWNSIAFLYHVSWHWAGFLILLLFQCFWKVFKRAVGLGIKDEFLENNIVYAKLTGLIYFVLYLAKKKKYSFVIWNSLSRICLYHSIIVPRRAFCYLWVFSVYILFF